MSSAETPPKCDVRILEDNGKPTIYRCLCGWNGSGRLSEILRVVEAHLASNPQGGYYRFGNGRKIRVEAE